MRQERIMVKAGEEKKMAAASPRGRLATASKMERSRKPPRTP